MRYGYTRVSTSDQTTSLQDDALTKIGCERIFTDVISGKVRHRPGLNEALRCLQPGDTLTVWRLDRLGRSLSDLIEIMSIIQLKNCEFQSLTEAIDTRTASGKLIFHIIAALSEFERHLIVERTSAGLAAAKARGVRLGRRPKLSARKAAELRRAVEGGLPKAEAAKAFRIGRSTLYRCLAVYRRNDQTPIPPGRA